jgi:threonine dehydratase
VKASRSLGLPRLDELRAARERLSGLSIRTPLLRLRIPEAGFPVWLKLENLQPIGSFKIRGAGNAMRQLSADALRDGVCTASAGNMAQGVAWCARDMGVPCRVIVPDQAPKAKTDAVEALGASVIRVPFEDWWKVMESHETRGVAGAFIHPVENSHVIAGNGTIALEIVDELPDVVTVIVPFGGGGLISGIGAGLRALRPNVRVIAAEVETAAPLRASLDAGEPRAIQRIPSFVDGIGGASVLPGMWSLVRQVVDECVVVSLDEVVAAIRILVRQGKMIAEGAGAASLAVARSGQPRRGPVVCVISGGNIDAAVLGGILASDRRR